MRTRPRIQYIDGIRINTVRKMLAGVIIQVIRNENVRMGLTEFNDRNRRMLYVSIIDAFNTIRISHGGLRPSFQKWYELATNQKSQYQFGLFFDEVEQEYFHQKRKHENIQELVSILKSRQFYLHQIERNN